MSKVLYSIKGEEYRIDGTIDKIDGNAGFYFRGQVQPELIIGHMDRKEFNRFTLELLVFEKEILDKYIVTGKIKDFLSEKHPEISNLEISLGNLDLPKKK